MGRSIRGISGNLKTACSTVRDWLLRMRDRGLKGRFSAKPRGRRGGLSPRILRIIGRRPKGSPRRCGFETGSWQLNMIIEMIRRAFGILAKARTLRRRLRRMMFSRRKNRHVPYKSAPEEKQEEFKKMTGERAAQMRSSGLEVFVKDEAANQMLQNPSCGWRARRGAGAGWASHSGKSIRIFGAMSQGELRVKMVDSTNSETFLEFIDDIQRDHPGFYMVSWTTPPATSLRPEKSENTESHATSRLASGGIFCQSERIIAASTRHVPKSPTWSSFWPPPQRASRQSPTGRPSRP